MKKVILLALLIFISIIPGFAEPETRTFPIGASVGNFHQVIVSGETSSEKPIDLNSDQVRDVQVGECVGLWSIYSNYNPLTVKIEADDLTDGKGSQIPYLLKLSYDYAVYENGSFKEDADGVFYVGSKSCVYSGNVEVQTNNSFSFKAAYQPQGISSVNQEIRLIVPEGTITNNTKSGNYSATVTITITGGEQ